MAALRGQFAAIAYGSFLRAGSQTARELQRCVPGGVDDVTT